MQMIELNLQIRILFRALDASFVCCNDNQSNVACNSIRSEFTFNCRSEIRGQVYKPYLLLVYFYVYRLIAPFCFNETCIHKGQ